MTDSQNSAPAGTLRTVFLDRDGVINKKMPEGAYVPSWANFQLLPGVPEAIAQLNQAGLRVVVVSNQRGIALGLYSARDVETIHANLPVNPSHPDGLASFFDGLEQEGISSAEIDMMSKTNPARILGLD